MGCSFVPCCWLLFKGFLRNPPLLLWGELPLRESLLPEDSPRPLAECSWERDLWEERSQLTAPDPKGRVQRRSKAIGCRVTSASLSLSPLRGETEPYGGEDPKGLALPQWPAGWLSAKLRGEGESGCALRFAESFPLAPDGLRAGSPLTSPPPLPLKGERSQSGEQAERRGGERFLRFFFLLFAVVSFHCQKTKCQK